MRLAGFLFFLINFLSQPTAAFFPRFPAGFGIVEASMTTLIRLLCMPQGHRPGAVSGPMVGVIRQPYITAHLPGPFASIYRMDARGKQPWEFCPSRFYRGHSGDSSSPRGGVFKTGGRAMARPICSRSWQSPCIPVPLFRGIAPGWMLPLITRE